MQSMDYFIQEAVSKIQGMESKRRTFSQKILPLLSKKIDKINSKEILEEKLVFPVSKAELNCKIAGVDSGFVSKDMLALDLVLVRAVGTVFEYRESKVVKASYYPNYYSFPSPYMGERALEADEFSCSKSIRRLILENNAAKALIEEHNPEYCFLDGSIVPQYPDKPRNDSSIKDFYHELIQNFQELYKTAEKHKCTLIASVEDSRGSRFRSILQQDVLAKQGIPSKELDDCYDSILLDYLLKQGERSMAFKYSPDIEKHPILMDFDQGFAEKVHAFYLKPVEYDRPLRIEFLHDSKNDFGKFVDEIAGIVFATASLHREYAYPSVLIEADMRARLKPEEIDTVYQKILDKVGRNVNLRMRRSNRPF
ncbi:MAG: DNA double-strand break repair nuclease NurA [Candidatus Diapherotrites archaeon]|nr:DNA double-strand break repair nuclease NurA [Candidatus Diapherotrites archaeon]